MNLGQNCPSNFDKKESKSKMQSILVVLERLNGEHLISERERERHTPLIFELERQKCPKLFAPQWGARRPALDFLVAGPLQLKI